MQLTVTLCFFMYGRPQQPLFPGMRGGFLFQCAGDPVPA
ncbi:hypothetical protein HM1_2989 [Heliomicrobium modesticaldum Ice1]|uniref:Uncharacterized protein n=1 Tax=Heliobacterium modesticaldum (strain ATCC 51547 / Ice1) TaxID=498761 RepID=B0TDH4_HELMI|nr:hypothetical protein HM1_2989 [Heliomicrobium modesticaldum Ice1]